MRGDVWIGVCQMAVQIQIIVDDNQKVQIVEAGDGNLREALATVLVGWKQQAVEPCSAGKKCGILQGWIGEIEGLLK